MTLKEKFKSDDLNLSNLEADECEKIADDFAIGFAEWVNDNCWNIESDRYLYQDDQYRTNQLLEIYKKEKGL